MEGNLYRISRVDAGLNYASAGILVLSSIVKCMTLQENLCHPIGAEFIHVKNVGALPIQCHENFFVFEFHLLKGYIRSSVLRKNVVSDSQPLL